MLHAPTWRRLHMSESPPEYEVVHRLVVAELEDKDEGVDGAGRRRHVVE